MSEHPNIPATPQPSTPAWRGINHLALVTYDMDATVRFYHGVLGARLVTTIGTPSFRHYFFEFGQRTRWRSSSTPTSSSKLRQAGRHSRSAGIQFDHLSFNVPDDSAARRSSAGSRAPAAK